LIQNDEHPHVPANGKLFLPVELCNMLSPLDGGERLPLVSHFIEKHWLPHKGQDPARCVRRFMQKALKNLDKRTHGLHTGEQKTMKRTASSESNKLLPFPLLGTEASPSTQSQD
jgi:hypothetical protein